MDMIDSIIDERIKNYLPSVRNEELENYKKDEERKKEQNEYLTIDELAELTGLKKATIYAKRTNRELPAYKFGRELRFRRDEIQRWIDSKKLLCLPKREGRSI